MELTIAEMIVGKRYDIVFATGKYEIEYEYNLELYKITKKMYIFHRVDGSQRRVWQGGILSSKMLD